MTKRRSQPETVLDPATERWLAKLPKREQAAKRRELTATALAEARQRERILLDDRAQSGGGQIPPQGAYGRISIVHAEVDNPAWEPGHPDHLRKVTVAKNARRDVLEWEFGRRQISEAAYLQGRMIQRALEIRGGSGQAQWSEGDRVDAGSLVSLAIARNLDRAAAANHVIAHCLTELGKHEGGRLVACLRQPGTWATIAAKWGLAGAKAQERIAWRFREGLEHLAKNPP